MTVPPPFGTSFGASGWPDLDSIYMDAVVAMTEALRDGVATNDDLERG